VPTQTAGLRRAVRFRLLGRPAEADAAASGHDPQDRVLTPQDFQKAGRADTRVGIKLVPSIEDQS
jgi:hypothetical protein